MEAQQHLIERVAEVARADERLAAVLSYGSFTKGTADRFSDIEFQLFFRDDEWAGVDQEAWVRAVAEVDLFLISEEATPTAIFSNLVIGEFHFLVESQIPSLWNSANRIHYPAPEAGIVLDRTGELLATITAILESKKAWHPTSDQQWFVSTNFILWLLFATNRLARGERARALDTLTNAHRCLLSMARVVEGTSDQFRPHLQVERRLSEAFYARYAAATSSVDESAMWSACINAWSWGRDLMTSLAERFGWTLPAQLFGKLDRLFAPELPPGVDRRDLLVWP